VVSAKLARLKSELKSETNDEFEPPLYHPLAVSTLLLRELETTVEQSEELVKVKFSMNLIKVWRRFRIYTKRKFNVRQNLTKISWKNLSVSTGPFQQLYLFKMRKLSEYYSNA